MSVLLVIIFYVLSIFVTIQIMDLAWGVELVSLGWLICGGFIQTTLQLLIVASMRD